MLNEKDVSKFKTQLLKMGLSKVVNTAATEILKYTPQLYLKTSNTEPVRVKPHATAVLINYEGFAYVLTAGHILENKGKPIDPRDIGVLIDGYFCSLGGQLKVINSTLEDHGKIDISICKLLEGTISILEKGYEFLDSSQIITDLKVTNDQSFLIVGYPITRTKFKYQELKMRVSPFVFITGVSNKKKYKRLNIEEDSKIILEYHKSAIGNLNSSQLTEGPDPYGISGSGLWYLPNLSVGTKASYKLAGIMIEWHREETAIIAMRIDYATQIIKIGFGIDNALDNI